MALDAQSAQYDRYLAVEISEDARLIASNACPHKLDRPRLDHSWHSNMLDITEQDIIDLGYNSIKQFLAGTPCQDFCKLRLITRRRANQKGI